MCHCPYIRLYLNSSVNNTCVQSFWFHLTWRQHHFKRIPQKLEWMARTIVFILYSRISLRLPAAVVGLIQVPIAAWKSKIKSLVPVSCFIQDDNDRKLSSEAVAALDRFYRNYLSTDSVLKIRLQRLNITLWVILFSWQFYLYLSHSILQIFCYFQPSLKRCV